MIGDELDDYFERVNLGNHVYPYACRKCSAVVANKTKHLKWHTNLLREMRSIAATEPPAIYG